MTIRPHFPLCIIHLYTSIICCSYILIMSYLSYLYTSIICYSYNLIVSYLSYLYTSIICYSYILIMSYLSYLYTSIIYYSYIFIMSYLSYFYTSIICYSYTLIISYLFLCLRIQFKAHHMHATIWPQDPRRRSSTWRWRASCTRLPKAPAGNAPQHVHGPRRSHTSRLHCLRGWVSYRYIGVYIKYYNSEYPLPSLPASRAVQVMKNTVFLFVARGSCVYWRCSPRKRVCFLSTYPERSRVECSPHCCVAGAGGCCFDRGG